MKKLLPIVLVFALSTSAFAQEQGIVDHMKEVIQNHLGRPYVWGSAGLKSFDCSGFIWRVLFDNGVMTKRTTARKYYMMLPKIDPETKWQFGTIVFFDNLKHVGIVDSSKTFYHAQVSRGTNLSVFDPFWRPKIAGFRGLPVTESQRAQRD